MTEREIYRSPVGTPLEQGFYGTNPTKGGQAKRPERGTRLQKGRYRTIAVARDAFARRLWAGSDSVSIVIP